MKNSYESWCPCYPILMVKLEFWYFSSVISMVKLLKKLIITTDLPWGFTIVKLVVIRFQLLCKGEKTIRSWDFIHFIPRAASSNFCKGQDGNRMTPARARTLRATSLNFCRSLHSSLLPRPCPSVPSGNLTTLMWCASFAPCWSLQWSRTLRMTMGTPLTSRDVASFGRGRDLILGQLGPRCFAGAKDNTQANILRSSQLSPPPGTCRCCLARRRRWRSSCRRCGRWGVAGHAMGLTQGNRGIFHG